MFKCLLFAVALAGVAPATAQPITVEEARRAVRSTSALIRQHYVDSKLRAPTAQLLERNLAANRYDKRNVRELAAIVTDDLRQFTKDSHMALHWDPAAYERRRAEALSPADAAIGLADAVQNNHGLVETRILPGNVRYLKVTKFAWIPDVTGAAYDAAMRFLRDGSAVIVDLRGNSGGHSSAVKYAISHFMPAASETLMITFTGDDGNPDQTRAIGYLPAGRVTAPLFVLTDGNSVSAAEEFTYHVRHFKLGKTVGSKTVGAANNNQFYPVDPGFVASISVHRPIHAVTGKNWEGMGIEPDLPAAGGSELKAAHVAALEGIAAKASGKAKAAAQWALVQARFDLSPPSLSPGQLGAYTARFEGERDIRVEGGRLIYRRADRPPAGLVFLGDDIFGFTDTDYVRLHLPANSRTLTVLYGDGSSITARRID